MAPPIIAVPIGREELRQFCSDTGRSSSDDGRSIRAVDIFHIAVSWIIFRPRFRSPGRAASEPEDVEGVKAKNESERLYLSSTYILCFHLDREHSRFEQ